MPAWLVAHGVTQTALQNSAFPVKNKETLFCKAVFPSFKFTVFVII